jgi:hypothetical protein
LILRGELNNENPCPPDVGQGFFVVAESNEISNLDLIRDIDRIIKLVEALSIIK